MNTTTNARRISLEEVAQFANVSLDDVKFDVRRGWLKQRSGTVSLKAYNRYAERKEAEARFLYRDR